MLSQNLHSNHGRSDDVDCGFDLVLHENGLETDCNKKAGLRKLFSSFSRFFAPFSVLLSTSRLFVEFSQNFWYGFGRQRFVVSSFWALRLVSQRTFQWLFCSSQLEMPLNSNKRSLLWRLIWTSNSSLIQSRGILSLQTSLLFVLWICFGVEDIKIFWIF